jgi:hypothetical protein
MLRRVPNQLRVDATLLRVLKTPVRTPQANGYCERFIGTAGRECLDWMIPLHERHLRRILAESIAGTSIGPKAAAESAPSYAAALAWRRVSC